MLTEAGGQEVFEVRSAMVLEDNNVGHFSERQADVLVGPSMAFQLDDPKGLILCSCDLTTFAGVQKKIRICDKEVTKMLTDWLF